MVVRHIPFDIRVESPAHNGAAFSLMITGSDEVVFTYDGVFPATIHNVRVPASGHYQVVVTTRDSAWESAFRSIPGWMTLLPPLLAIALALLLRQVHVALFAGVWLGAFFVKDFNPLVAFGWVVQHYVVDSLAGPGGWDHTSIAIFTLLLGGMVGVLLANGGAAGAVKVVARRAKTAASGQLAAWALGLVIFFDDYTNTLIVGNTMRPITDRLRISREKLSYIVDSTAAPVACIAVITSWVGFEISLLKDAFDSVGEVTRNPFATFVSSIRYSYYPILALFFVFLVARLGRDFGPMLHAERRARRTGEVLDPHAIPISNIDQDVPESAGVEERWVNGVIPIVVVVAMTIFGLVLTGREALVAAGTSDPGWFDALRRGNSFVALLWSSFAGGCVAIGLTVAQRLMPLTATINAWVAGVKAMAPAMVILVLAWAIGAVCADLHTADYLVSHISGVIAPSLLPALIFLIAAGVSFATGTSWGTMTILTPLCIPLVIQMGHMNGLDPATQESVLLATIAAILSGSVFGDHCSPISDTTIMSSMASMADHIDHVRTQLPYALSVAGISLCFGYVPFALGAHAGIGLALSVAATFAVVRFLGRRVDATE